MISLTVLITHIREQYTISQEGRMFMLESRKVQTFKSILLFYLAFSPDYTGEDVTAENFLAVLKGNKAAMEGKGSGKVLDSGPNDEGI